MKKWLIPLLVLIPAISTGTSLTIGIGRNFYDGPESATFLHGSTRSWEALVDLDDQLRPVPWLAISWISSDDKRTWIFKIRENVKFHNGDTLRAQDVVQSIQRLNLHPKFDPFDRYKILEEIKAIDEHRVIFKLSRPCAFFPNLVAYYGSPIFHPSSWDEKGRIKNFIATGPYKPEFIIPDEQVTLVRNNDYWGTRPSYERVTFRVLQDSHARLIALISGRIDAVIDVGGILPDQRSVLHNYPEIAVKSKEVATTHYLVFNTAKHPFNNRDIRRWLAGAIDRQSLVDNIMQNLAVIALDPYSRLNKSWSFSLLRFPSSPFPAGLSTEGTDTIVILLHSNTISRWPYMEIAQIIERLLKSRGIKAEILVQEKGLYYSRIKNGQFHIALQPFTMMTGDPDCFYSFFLKQTKLDHDVVRELTQTAKEAIKENYRAEAYRRLEEILSEEVPLVPLFHDVALYAYRFSVGNLGMDALFRPVFDSIENRR